MTLRFQFRHGGPGIGWSFAPEGAVEQPAQEALRGKLAAAVLKVGVAVLGQKPVQGVGQVAVYCKLPDEDEVEGVIESTADFVAGDPLVHLNRVGISFDPDQWPAVKATLDLRRDHNTVLSEWVAQSDDQPARLESPVPDVRHHELQLARSEVQALLRKVANLEQELRSRSGEASILSAKLANLEEDLKTLQSRQREHREWREQINDQVAKLPSGGPVVSTKAKLPRWILAYCVVAFAGTLIAIGLSSSALWGLADRVDEHLKAPGGTFVALENRIDEHLKPDGRFAALAKQVENLKPVGTLAQRLDLHLKTPDGPFAKLASRVEQHLRTPDGPFATLTGRVDQLLGPDGTVRKLSDRTLRIETTLGVEQATTRPPGLVYRLKEFLGRDAVKTTLAQLEETQRVVSSLCTEIRRDSIPNTPIANALKGACQKPPGPGR